MVGDVRVQHIFFIVVLAILPMSVHAAICPASYYLNKNNECIICNTLKSGPSIGYCPGDGLKYPCPKTETDYEAEYGL